MIITLFRHNHTTLDVIPLVFSYSHHSKRSTVISPQHPYVCYFCLLLVVLFSQPTFESIQHDMRNNRLIELFFQFQRNHLITQDSWGHPLFQSLFHHTFIRWVTSNSVFPFLWIIDPKYISSHSRKELVNIKEALNWCSTEWQGYKVIIG